MTDSEKYNDKPKVHGLRRMVELLIGPIVDNLSDPPVNEKIKIVYSKNGSEETTLFVLKTSVRNVLEVHDIELGRIRRTTGIADSSPLNTAPGFLQYQDAIAQTRARGRSYVDMLGIQTVTAEECEEKPAIKVDMFQEKITGNQFAAIDVLTKKLDVNAKTFISGYVREFGHSRISEISKSEASEMIKYLNQLQQGKEEVPENLKGYKQGWREALGIKDE
jgi:hypothetical protein